MNTTTVIMVASTYRQSNCHSSTAVNSATSTMVGISCRITIRTMTSMPARPRSSTRVSPPVLRSR